jgi:hypothetical protein
VQQTDADILKDVWDKANSWITNNEADVILQGVLKEAGSYYKSRLEEVSECATGKMEFKNGLDKKDFSNGRAGYTDKGEIETYAPAFKNWKGDLKNPVTELNKELTRVYSGNADEKELNVLGKKVETWNQRSEDDWAKIYPDWIPQYTTAIKEAAGYYEKVLEVIAVQDAGAPEDKRWKFKPGLTRAAVLKDAQHFDDERAATPCAIKIYKVSDDVFKQSYQLRSDGLYPFRLYNNRYDLATARARMADAAAQIGFALAMLLHRTVRRKMLLSVASGKFERLSDGAIMTDNITHPAMTLQGGEQWTPFGLSMGCDQGVFFTSHFTPFRLYALTAHEWAHVLILQHWFNAGGAPKTEHDQSDMNCMMGYPYLIGEDDKWPAENTKKWKDLEDFVASNGLPEKYQTFFKGQEGGSFAVKKVRMLPKNHLPHFCGKCNLQLRGWNIYAGANDPVLPRSSNGPHNEDAFPAVQDYKALEFDKGNL